MFSMNVILCLNEQKPLSDHPVIQILYIKQVCRPAIQALGELYLILGKSMEMDLDKVVVLLLQKAADTNRFLR